MLWLSVRQQRGVPEKKKEEYNERITQLNKQLSFVRCPEAMHPDKTRLLQ